VQFESILVFVTSYAASRELTTVCKMHFCNSVMWYYFWSNSVNRWFFVFWSRTL